MHYYIQKEKYLGILHAPALQISPTMSQTGANNKRIAKNSLYLYVRTVFVMLVSLYTSRVILKTLGVVDFGIYNVVGGVVVLFSFLSNAMSASIQRFFSFELGRGGSKRLQDIFSMSVNIHIILALLVLMLAETVGLWIVFQILNIPEARMGAALWVYHCSALSFAITIIQVPFSAIIISHEKMNIFALLCIIDVMAKLIIVLILPFFPIDKLCLYALLLFVVQLGTCSLYLTYALRHFSECKARIYWNKHIFYELTSYTSWNLFGGLSSVLSNQGVNILLNIFFGPAVNAARGIALQVNSATNSLFTSFIQAVNPQIVKQYSAGELAYMHKLIYKSSRYSFFLISLIATPVLLETETLLKLWLTEVPEHLVSFVRLVIIASLIDSLSSPLITAAQATGKIKQYQMLVGGELVLIVPLSFIFLSVIPTPEVAFIISILMGIIALATRLLLLKKLIRLSIRKFAVQVITPVLLVACLGATASIVPLIMPLGWPRLILSLIGGELIICIAILLVGTEKAERQFIIQKIRK